MTPTMHAALILLGLLAVLTAIGLAAVAVAWLTDPGDDR